MKRIAIAYSILCFSMLPFSCQKLLTTSLGTSLTTEIRVSSDWSVEELLALGNKYNTPETAAAVYEALSEKLDSTDIADLPANDKTTILAMAVTASGIEDSMLSLLTGSLKSGTNLEDLKEDDISDALVDLINSSDFSVTSSSLFTALSNDPDTLKEASQEVLVLAALATAAGAASEVVDTATLASGKDFDDILTGLDTTAIAKNQEQFAAAATLMQQAVDPVTGDDTPKIFTSNTSTDEILKTLQDNAGKLPDSLGNLFSFDAS